MLFVGGLNSEHLLLSAVVASSVSAAVCGRVHIGATWRIQWIDLRVSLASSVSAAVRGDIGWGGRRWRHLANTANRSLYSLVRVGSSRAAGASTRGRRHVETAVACAVPNIAS